MNKNIHAKFIFAGSLSKAKALSNNRLATVASHVRYLVIPFATFAFLVAGFPQIARAASVSVWWPTDDAHVQGTQPFKALLDGASVDRYDMYWAVDGGGLVPMPSNYDGYPHKETSVNLSGWNWKGKGPYAVTIVAKQNGAEVAKRTVNIYNDSATAPITSGTTVLTASGTSAPAQTPTVPAPQTTPSATSGTATPTQTQTTTQTQTQTAPITTTGGTPTQTSVTPTAPTPTKTIDIWWPTANATLTGTQPFKGLVQNMNVDSYTMYWAVDGGGAVPMPTSYDGYPHKETTVDLSGWRWNGNGTYTLTFTAKDQTGAVIATRQVPIIVPTSPQATSGTATTQTQTQTQTATTPSSSNVQPAASTVPVVNSSGLYVNPNSSAAGQAAQWRASRPADARAMDLLAAQPTAVWFGGWNANIYNDARALVQNAAMQGKTAVMIAYNIPQRDCGGFSAGGTGSPDAYRSWIAGLASGIGGNKAIVILEPDALSQIDCLSSADQQTRLSLLSGAVNTLKSNGNTAVYIDAGHSGWVDAGTMAARLQGAGIARADGFALNVSNFQATNSETDYGTQLSQKLGGLPAGQAGKHFVIDTSRNGLGGNGQWCNPSGRAIGQKPTMQTGNPLIDAYLWLKVPGESDGWCNGGPAAGQWWPDYALGLVQRGAYSY